MLDKLLLDNKEAILKKWLQLVVETYPKDSQQLLATKSDRFSNPVSADLHQGLEGLFNGLMTAKEDAYDFSEFLDKVVRIRAVQDFTPANALVFLFYIKNAVREILAPKINEYGIFEELLNFESKVDSLVLLAFNIYMSCREDLCNVRIAEINRRTSRIWERVCRKYGVTPESVDSDEDKITQ